MKKIGWSILILMFMSSVAMANVTVTVSYGGYDGPANKYPHVITLVPGSDPLGPTGPYYAGDSFDTFCLEYTETIHGGPFDVDLSMGAIAGGIGGSPDPLDNRTAWIYLEYLAGNIGTDKAYDAQVAIWVIEEEQPLSYLSQAAYAQDIYNAAGLGAAGWSDTHGVMVMNLTRSDESLAQDHVVLIPAPGAILLAGLGTGLVGWMKRRKISL